MTAFADSMIADLRTRAQAAFDEFGAEVKAGLVESLSVPVERSGSSVIRSAPGEPPREETSEYLESIGHETQAEATSVTTTIFTDMLRGVWLERGTSRMAARPHFAPIYERYAALAAETIGRRMFTT